MEPARRKKNRRTRSTAIGTKKISNEEEPTAMEISESERDTPRKEKLEEIESSFSGKMERGTRKGRERRKLGDHRTTH